MKSRSLSYLLASVLTLVGSQPALAFQSPEAVVTAMDIDMSLVVSGSIATPAGPSGDPTSGQMFDVRTALGVVSPYNAPTMGLLFTGNVDQITNYTGAFGDDHDYPGSGGTDTSAGDYVTLTFNIEVPIYANSFSFNFNFLSREYPEWVGSAFNDTFEVFLASNAYNGQIVFDAFGNPVTVNNALFVIDSFNDPSQLPGTGFDQDGATGWVTTIAPCDPGEIMTLSFEIYDVGDGVWDSAVLLDNFAFSEQDVPDGPWTGDDTPDEPLRLAYASPKEGDLDGGITVTLNGANFSHDTSVYWDGTLVDTANTVVETGGDRLRIEGIPEAPDTDGDGIADYKGPIDIRLVRGTDETTLDAGFTYWDFSAGSAPPRVTAVGPNTPANPGGGALIRVRGTGFADGARVLFIDAEEELEGTNAATLEGGEEIQINVPAHAEGWVDLVVENPDGLRSHPGYPFLYSTDAAPAPVNTDDALRTDGGCSVGGSPSDSLSFLAMLLVGLFVIRRREKLAANSQAAVKGVLTIGLVAITPLLGCSDSGVRLLPNRPPVAVAAIDNGPEDESVQRLGYTVLGDTAGLDGSDSRDPDNEVEEFIYQWSFEAVPEGSTVTNESIVIPDEDPETETLESALANFVPDLLGTYRLNLVVIDTKELPSLPAVVVVQAVPPSSLQVELEWNTARSDLDLHLIAPNGNYFGSYSTTDGSTAGDCFSWAPNPDWGDPSMALDNPLLLADSDGEGEGPFRETILLELPPDTCDEAGVAAGDCSEVGNYRIWVHYYSDHTQLLLGPDGAQPAEATVTISVLGQEIGGGPVTTPSPLQDGEIWKVGELSWPAREFYPVNSTSSHGAEGGPSYNDQL